MGLIPALTRPSINFKADTEPFVTSIDDAQVQIPSSLSKLLARRPRRRLRIRRPRLRLRRPSTDTSADILVLAGLASITAACGWIYPPAAPFTGGVFLLALGLTIAGSDGGDEPASRIVERWYADGDDGDD
jgi:hypothetical protein